MKSVRSIDELIGKRSNPGLIAPSLLSADFSILREEVAAVCAADLLHIDVMDGHFVPNLTLGPTVVQAIQPHTRLPLDCHLMVSHPDEWIAPFVQAGAQIVTIHVEAAKNLKASLKRIRELGCYAGVSLSPQTPVSAIESVLADVDLVLVMSVYPGFGGQKFIPESLDKVRELTQLRGKKKFLIEIDGGINVSTIRDARQAGCDVFVAGSAIFSERDRNLAIRTLRQAMEVA